jgi:hypothetical protein
MGFSFASLNPARFQIHHSSAYPVKAMATVPNINRVTLTADRL